MTDVQGNGNPSGVERLSGDITNAAMSNPQSTVLNGPSGELTMAFKEAAHPNQDTNKVNQPAADLIQTGYAPRPQLQRNDSRVGLPQRPQFNPQFRPQQPQFQPQQNPQFQPQNPQFQQQQQNPQLQQQNQQFQQQNPQLQNQQFQQRPQFPVQGQIRPGPPLQRPLAPNQPPPQRQPIPPVSANQRPQFIRPQQQPPLRPPGPPPPVQQPQQPPKPVIKTPNLEQPEIQAQIITKDNDGNMKPPVSPAPEMERRVSVDSAEENRPSRPESRASSAMKVIPETVDKPKTLPLNTSNGQDRPPPKAPDTKMSSKPPLPPSKKEGDNDSGVDESTQGNEPSTNGEHSPRKSARNTSRLTTPTKNRSFSRGSRSPNLKSPDSTPSTPGGEKKKLPMNKIQVGSAPSPNLKVVKSKIGSLSNANYKPGGGNVKIETKKIDVSSAHSKIGAKNETYTPSGGDKKIVHQKLQWSAKSKIGSLENATHKPKGGDKKIESVKLDFKEKAKPKVGSKDNVKHQPGGGDIKSARGEKLKAVKQESVDIETKKLNIKGESKVGSLDNVKHRPGGGDKKIFDDKDYLRQMSSGLSNENNSVCGSQNSLPSQPDAREPVSDENLNREH